MSYPIVSVKNIPTRNGSFLSITYEFGVEFGIHLKGFWTISCISFYYYTSFPVVEWGIELPSFAVQASGGNPAKESEGMSYRGSAFSF